MAMASLGSAASSLVLFSRRVLRPELTALCSYHTKVVDHYENPRNVGTLDKNAKNVGTGLVGAPACGDVMKLQIQVDENGKIVDAKFKTFGCGSAIASSSLATEWVKGKSVDEALKIRNTDIAKELCLPPVKLHCSMLAEDAIKAALSDYRVKQDMEKKWQVQTEWPELVPGLELCCTSSRCFGCSLCLGTSLRFSTSSASLTFLTSGRGDDRTSLPLSPTRALEGTRRCLGEATL
uniref:Iron-sulfur cluster assembly enzyme ISCU n=1 Tax=Gasterosteus aculeatus aculeatus TaxID=481459 RepID=G3P208_GASAC